MDHDQDRVGRQLNAQSKLSICYDKRTNKNEKDEYKINKLQTEIAKYIDLREKSFAGKNHR